MKATRYEISGASALVSACQVLLFGPIPLEHNDATAWHIANSGSVAIALSYVVSVNENRELEAVIPPAMIDNTASTVAAGGIIVGNLIHRHGYSHLSVLGSATASIGVSQIRMVVLGKGPH